MELPPNPDPDPRANNGKGLGHHRDIFLAGLRHELGEAGQATHPPPLDGNANFAMDGVEFGAGPGVEPGVEAVLAKDNPGAVIAPDTNDDAPAVIGVMDLDGGGAENIPLPGVLLPNELRRNPPVGIQDWPEPGSDNESEAGSAADKQIENGDQEPMFVEQPEQIANPAQPILDPMHEHDVADQALRGLMEMQLGDLADEEWLHLYTEILTKNDENTLQLLSTRLRTHFSRQTYHDLRYGICESLNIPSEFIAWRRLRILSGLEIHVYDCCINSCCCFLGKHADLEACPFCNQPRYTASGQPQRSFHYTPLIPQLQALFRSPDMVEKLKYRSQAEAQREAGIIQDVFDGENYHELRATQPDPNKPYQCCDYPTDIVLAFSTDGFRIFKQRRKGYSTAWPLIFVNFNIHPKYRTRLWNVICVGVIPGPRQCKDLNSYLAPVVDDLKKLEQGVQSWMAPPAGNPDRKLVEFVLHAFLITIFGDIPAVSKVLALKGHTVKVPCRACYIRGVLYKGPEKSTYYYPLTAPGQLAPTSPDQLFMRDHALFLHHYKQLDDAPNQARRNELAQNFGIVSRPIFSCLKSINLATCAPYDIMHLLFENLVPNLILHWTGRFKLLDQGTETYELDPGEWKTIRKLTADASCTIPSAFVGALPDIAQEGYKAEAHSFWFQYIAPIVLKGRLQEPYYSHFLVMREIVMRCLQFEITHEEIDMLEDMVNTWVQDYERYYYQHSAERLPACPVTIHALLHMPYYIRRSGPLWTSWAFIMERFCGHLLPAVKNRVKLFVHLDNYVLRRAQMQAVSIKYDLPSLTKPTVKYTYRGDERISSCERMYDTFPHVVLGVPIRSRPPIDTQLKNQLTKYFGVIYDTLTAARLRERLIPDSLVRYGQFRLTDDGDKIRTASAVGTDPDSRDNSFVRYALLPDANAAFRNRPDVPVRQTNYGQVVDIFYIEFMEDPENNVRKPYLLTRVQGCETNGLDAALPENPFVTYRKLTSPYIIHIDTIEAVIGRIKIDHNTWAIIDRSRNGARTQFVDEDGNNLE